MPTTVDKIRRALEKRDGIAEEEMRPLADAYRSDVQSVNQRLDDAIMLLRKGLRSEAIQRVEMTPNALDAATELEFPEWDEWNEILQFMGIPLPPKLNQDYVAQINEAIIESLPLDALLGRHRRLAIAKAPLGVRLRTLRQISRVDSANGVWQDDVEAWEKIRLQQIETEMKMSLERNDTGSLYQLHRELTAAPWRLTPPTKLVEQGASAAQAHVRNSQQVVLSQIAPQLIAAFNARDEATARGLRTQWQAARAKYNVSVPADFEATVAPAMQWMEDLDRQAVMESERQLAMANLESSLESDTSIEEVKKAYDEASRFGEPMPETLAERVQELEAAPQKKRKRKLQLIGAGVAAVAVLLGGAYVQWSSTAKAAKALDGQITQMKQFVESEQYSQAIDYFNSIRAVDPSAATNATMLSLQTSAQSAITQEASRVEKFNALYADANNQDASLIDEVLLPQLEELAVSVSEKGRVSDLVKRKEDYKAGEANRQSDEMISKISDMRAEFVRLRSRGSSSDDRRAIQGLLSEITRVPTKFPRASEEAGAQYETLRSQVSSILKQMKDDGMITEMREDAIESLMTSRSLSVFADQLREYSTQSVAQTNFAEFRTVIDEEDHWRNIDRVNAWLNEELGGRFENGITSIEAIDLLASAEGLQRDIAPNPVFQAMPGLLDALKEIRTRKNILRDGFANIAKHPLGKAISIPEPDPNSPSGVRQHLVYATSAEASREKFQRSGSIGLEVISNSMGEVRNRSFNGPVTGLSNEPMKSFEWILNERATSAINYDSSWEATFIRQIMGVLKRTELDGVVKEWMINELIEMACRGSVRFKEQVTQTRAILARRITVRSRWHEPRSKNPSIDPALERTMRGELQIAYKRLAKPLARYESVAEKQLQWIGFLSKSMTGQIEYHVRGTMPEDDGKLYVAVPSNEGDAETSVIAVGNLESGHITLDPNPVHQIPGRPIFLFPN